MPRRKRTVKRRASDPLVAMAALAAADTFGCSAVDGCDLDDLYVAWEIGNRRAGSWSTLAFEDGDPAPCERMVRRQDPFTGKRPAPPGCDPNRCLFVRERAA